MWKTIWSDPVWSKVIAAAILGAAAIGGTYFFNWWPAIHRYSADALCFAVRTSTIPNWLTGLLALLSVPTLLLALGLLWEVVRPKKPEFADWRSYTEDNFFGLRWRWRYAGQSITEPHTFCPHCDFQIYPLPANGYGSAGNRVKFHCDSCHANLGAFDEGWISLADKAERFAQQKLRNGTWREKTNA